MRLLTEQNRDGSAGIRRIVSVFGSGLIGGSVIHALERNGWTGTDIPFDWRSFDARAEMAEKILNRTRQLTEAATDPVSISTVWTAGRNGFASTAAEMADEAGLLREVLDLNVRIQEALPDADHNFHHMSSAGGLFEGKSHVTATSEPAPLRPYGSGKLEQEAIVQGLPETIQHAIYRPSSVYGWRLGGRYGLFAALIRGAVEGRPTRIFGTVNTVRDYVYADDIARFVAAKVLRPGMNQTYLLASAKPTSMYEAIHVTEEIMNARLLLHYDTAPDNSRSMSFLPSALPSDWHVTPLRLGLSQMVRSIRDNLLFHR